MWKRHVIVAAILVAAASPALVWATTPSCPITQAQYVSPDSPGYTLTFSRIPGKKIQVLLKIHSPRTGRTYLFVPDEGSAAQVSLWPVTEREIADYADHEFLPDRRDLPGSATLIGLMKDGRSPYEEPTTTTTAYDYVIVPEFAQWSRYYAEGINDSTFVLKTCVPSPSAPGSP